MPHFEMTAFLTAAIGVLGLVSLCLLVFGRLGVGTIIAFLVAGVVIAEIRDIPALTVEALREFAELGVILLLFLIGVETQPAQLRDLGRDAVVLGAPQITVTALAIGLFVWWEFAGAETAIVLGLSFALSSTVVVVQLLSERNELHSSWGRKVFAVLLAQDLAIVPLLLIVSLLSERGSDTGPDVTWWWSLIRAVVVVVAVIIIGRYLLPWVLGRADKQHNDAAFACLTLLGVLAAALGAERVGLSMALGAFVLGATLSVSPVGHRVAQIVEPVKSTLIAIFFLSIGLSVDLAVVWMHWASLLLNTVSILFLKFVVIFAVVLSTGGSRADGLRISCALFQCGEFGFVLFGVAQAGNLMTAELSALASVLIALSMLTTPFVVRLRAAVAPERCTPVR